MKVNVPASNQEFSSSLLFVLVLMLAILPVRLSDQEITLFFSLRIFLLLFCCIGV